MAVLTTSPSPTTVIRSFGKNQPAYAPVETYRPILEDLAGSGPGALNERASGAGTSFDSLLCATLKALKGENPDTFTSLLQSCTSLIDSSSPGRMLTLKERNVVDDRVDLAAIESRSGKAILSRSETDLLEKRGLDTENLAESRHEKGSDSVLAPF